jgi:hypothetical protein
MSAFRKLAGQTVIGPNYWWLAAAVIMVCWFSTISALILFKGGVDSILYGSILLLLLVVPNAALLFLHPTRVRMNSNEERLELNYLVRRTVFIPLRGLYGFSAADHSMMRTSRKVRVLYHADGKHTECSEITLRSIDDLEGFLQRSGVRYLGFESSFFPFRKFTYRYDPK